MCKFRAEIKNISEILPGNVSVIAVLFTAENPDIYKDALSAIPSFYSSDNIFEIFLRPRVLSEKMQPILTKIGKYSYGPLIRQDPIIESIGAFCSFAAGTDVVVNHSVDYISTHPFLYYGNTLSETLLPPKDRHNPSVEADWFFPGVIPKGERHKERRITVGNDVWLGRNVIITNYANIGDGVIAAAGAIITKDVPDFAIVAGVPARIVKYRFSPEEIRELKRIAWWNWEDDKIRECYDDFFLPVKEFIRKHND